MSVFRTMVGTVGIVGMVGCGDPIQPMPEDLPCREAGYAIAARTVQCTGDAALGQARYDTFREEYTCLLWAADDPRLQDPTVWDTGPAKPHPADLFSCAFTLRNLPCELVAELGDDLAAWLAQDPGCTWVATANSAGSGGGGE